MPSIFNLRHYYSNRWSGTGRWWYGDRQWLDAILQFSHKLQNKTKMIPKKCHTPGPDNEPRIRFVCITTTVSGSNGFFWTLKTAKQRNAGGFLRKPGAPLATCPATDNNNETTYTPFTFFPPFFRCCVCGCARRSLAARLSFDVIASFVVVINYSCFLIIYNQLNSLKHLHGTRLVRVADIRTVFSGFSLRQDAIDRNNALFEPN